MSSNVKVMVRVRPFNTKEIETAAGQPLRSVIKMDGTRVAVVSEEREREAFEFDECFWSIPQEQELALNDFADQATVYRKCGQPCLSAALEGYNVCLFAYGQTGSGKSHTMLGSDEDPGISLRLVDELFARMEMNRGSQRVTTTVELTFMEIYNDTIRDLFNKHAKSTEYHPAKVRKHPTNGVYVDGLVRHQVDTADMCKRLLSRGVRERSVAATNLNDQSSRSHAIFQLMITQNSAAKGTRTVSFVNLVDLAGSERTDRSQVQGKELREANAINSSLSVLRRVMDAMVENATKKTKTLIPYRDSTLTWVLSDSLGGNSKTMMISTVSPSVVNMEESLSTLRYALKARSIVCNAKVNEVQSAEMIALMKAEILRLQYDIKHGVSPAMSGDQVQELADRKDALEKMEQQQRDTEVLLIETREQLSRAADERDAARIVLNKSKSEKFASAFRNAFRLKTDKQRADEMRLEIQRLAAEKERMAEEQKFYLAEVSSQDAELCRLREEREQLVLENQRGTQERDQMISQLRREMELGKIQQDALTTEVAELTQKLARVAVDNEDQRRRFTRLQEEVVHSSAEVARERAEKEALRTAFETKIAEMAADMEQLRKRKDKYKQTAMEAEARSQATASVLGMLQGDRDCMMQTIRAQQSMVEDRGAMTRQILEDRRAEQQRAAQMQQRLVQREADLKCMDEALREYQVASAAWMQEAEVLRRQPSVSPAASSPSPSRAPLVRSNSAAKGKVASRNNSPLPATRIVSSPLRR